MFHVKHISGPCRTATALVRRALRSRRREFSHQNSPAERASADDRPRRSLPHLLEKPLHLRLGAQVIDPERSRQRGGPGGGEETRQVPDRTRDDASVPFGFPALAQAFESGADDARVLKTKFPNR